MSGRAKNVGPKRATRQAGKTQQGSATASGSGTATQGPATPTSHVLDQPSQSGQSGSVEGSVPPVAPSQPPTVAHPPLPAAVPSGTSVPVGGYAGVAAPISRADMRRISEYHQISFQQN